MKKKVWSGSSRRTFLKNTSLAASGFFIVPRHVIGRGFVDIDAVTVSAPDNVHAVAAMAAMAAMQRGKHVYVQKPLTHDIYEARMLTEAVRKYKVVTQMGNQGGKEKGVRVMKEIFDAGLIGDVTQVQAWTNRPIWPQGQAKPTGKFDIPNPAHHVCDRNRMQHDHCLDRTGKAGGLSRQFSFRIDPAFQISGAGRQAGYTAYLDGRKPPSKKAR